MERKKRQRTGEIGANKLRPAEREYVQCEERGHAVGGKRVAGKLHCDTDRTADERDVIVTLPRNTCVKKGDR